MIKSYKWEARIGNFKVHALLLTFCFFYSCSASIDISKYKNHIIENVPFYAQETYQCGPASLAGVMNYRGVNVSPDEIAKEIYSESARGTLNIDMIIYPQKKGLEADQYSGGMDDIRKNIDAGYPLIVLVDYGFSVYQVNHFMVVIGYNEAGVIVNSGKNESKFIPEEDFIKSWERTKFWTLLIKKK